MPKHDVTSGGARVAPPEVASRGEVLLDAHSITKSFGGVVALGEASFQLRAGQVLGVVGENGAGKSTLMKVLAGVYPKGTYSGSFRLSDSACEFSTVKEARDAGIVLIPQELHIAPNLPIAENMFAGDLPSRFGFVSWAQLASQSREWLSFFDLDVEGNEAAKVLSPSQQRLAIIAGALSRNAKVLILDEPTASLSQGESQLLFQHLERLAREGIGVLFISHRLDDIEAVCHDLIVMRNGRIVQTLARASFDRKKIIAAMIGKEHHAESQKSPTSRTHNEAFTAEKVCLTEPGDPTRLRLKDVSLEVDEGEIVGLFGLVGAGRTELAQGVFGTSRGVLSGDLRLGKQVYRPQSPKHAVSSGIGLLTEDRKQTGIFPGHSVKSNLTSASLGKLSRFGFIPSFRETQTAEELVEQLRVKASSTEQHIEKLSGGNQQKVLLGRWLETKPLFLMLDEPTAGVDVGAREEIYQRIEDLAKSGCGVLVISSDLDEIARLCTRTYVMFDGRITGEFFSPVSKSELMAAATSS